MYAENTAVPIDRSQGEIRKILDKHKATSFAFGEQGNMAVIMFELKGLRIRFNLPMPTKPTHNQSVTNMKKYEQACRSKWRCLVLAIKAKLECVDNSITTLEQEFLAHIVLPNGSTVGTEIIPKLDQMYKSGNMPPLLGPGSYNE